MVTDNIDAILWRAEREYTIRVDIFDSEGVGHFLGYWHGPTSTFECEEECDQLGYWYRSNRMMQGKPYAEVRVYTGREMDGTDVTRSLYRLYAENIDAEQV